VTQASQSTGQQVAQLRDAMAQVGQLTVNVRDGKVTLDPAAGAQLLAALRAHGADIASWQRQVGDLSGALPLGNNPVANSMGHKFAQRADGDGLSLATVLAQYETAVADATDAIEQAMQRYADNEDSIGQDFGRIPTS
jgi:uncharacterized protein YgfB (UPF0149 family)